jgi:maleate cis-trans isomerase
LAQHRPLPIPDRSVPLLPDSRATYWHALRRNGIMDWFEGFGALMEEY